MAKKPVKNASLLFGQSLRNSITAVAKQLGTQDQVRLEALLAISSLERIGLDKAVQATFPDHANPLPVFNNFQRRFNELAEEIGVAIRLQKDTKTRDSLVTRFCWFTGPDPVIASVTQYNAAATRVAAGSVYVPSQGVVTTSSAEEKGKRIVRFFISYAHGDENRRESKLADELISFLRRHFAISLKYELDLWTDRKILLGTGWFKHIQQAISDCDFGILLVSPAFLGSQFIEQNELVHFVSDESQPSCKPVIPVGLVEFSFDQNLKGLSKGQIYLGHDYAHTQAKPVFYDSVRGDAAKNKYALDLTQRIEERLDHWFQSQPTLSKAAASSDIEPPSQSFDCGTVVPTVPESVKSLSLPESDGNDERRPTQALIQYNSTAKFRGFPDHFEPNHGTHGVLADRDRLETNAVEASRSQPAYDVLKAWAMDNDPQASPFFALLGEYGIGKSTTLQHFTRELTKERGADSSIPLPIYIDLRDYVSNHPLKDEHIPTIEELLDTVIERSWKITDRSVTSAQILHLVRNEGAVVLFDGLDERAVHLATDRAQAFIRTLWSVLPDATQEPQPGIQRGKMLISCRTHYFGDVASQNAMLSGENREQIDKRSFPILYLLPFSETQILSYLGKALGSEERAVTAQSLISRIHNLSELAQRPFLLGLITHKISELEKLAAGGQPVNAARLYELFVKDWLTRDNGKHQIEPDHKRRLMSALAAAMWRSGDKSWHVSRLESWFEQFLFENPVIAGAYVNCSRSILKEDLRTATFVLRPDTEDEAFSFAHSSLQEFFLALHLLQSLIDGQHDAWDLPLPSRETFAFFGELLQLHPSRTAIKSLEQLLGGEAGSNAGRNALGYWMQARRSKLPQPQPPRVVLPNVDLEEWNLCGTSDQALILRNADLQGAKLNRCRLEHVVLDGANLAQVQARDSVLVDVHAAHVDLQGSDLSGVRWRGGTLANAVLSSERDEPGSLSRLAGCQFLSVDLSNAQMPSDWQSVALAIPSRDPKLTFEKSNTSLTALGTHSAGAQSVSFSPDGARLLSGSDDDTVRLWDVFSGECLRTFNGHTSAVSSVSFSPDGQRLLSGSRDNTVRLWNIHSGECIRTFNGHTGPVCSVLFSPDGARLLSGSWDTTVRLWDVHSGECLRTFYGHTDIVRSVAFSPNGARLLSGSDDNTVRLCDIQSGDCLRTFNGQKGYVMSVSFSLDQARLLSGSWDNTLRLWDVESGECLRSFCGHARYVSSVSFSPDGTRLLSGSRDMTVRLWEVQSGECLRTFSEHTDTVNGVSLSPDGAHIVSCARDNTVLMWNVHSTECLRMFSRHINYVNSVSFSPDGASLLSGSDDSTVRLWDVKSGECLRTFNGKSGNVMSVAFSLDGARMLSGSWDNTIRMWDVKSGECLRTFKGHTSSVMSVSFSPDGARLLSGARDKTIRLWDIQSGECFRTFNGHIGGITSVSFSPDGTGLLSGSDDNTVRLWNVQSGECLRTFNGHKSYVMSVTFSPDGTSLLSGSLENTLRLWNVQSGECLRTFNGHTSSVMSVSFSPEGDRLLSGSWDKTVRLWDIKSGECLRTFNGHTNWVMSVSFSPDGTRLLSGSRDKMIRLWDVHSGECIWKAELLREGSWMVSDADDNILDVGGEAWRFAGWRSTDPVTGRQRILPLEYFGPVPWSKLPAGAN